ncbi:hypothetical protein M422DRAFT_262252 [Sphaerobolus stellatus SS14]|uniref:Tyr recombinase domain-containing protein n=1 Tax=Sphaerobolus stellatus (strain SS14) TaxID=990650 RepID=A0A0C9VDK9_SPHS4|nr:hypothetical protein M422DRAFT_262252 [Sphaerobolus stellatus SS14]
MQGWPAPLSDEDLTRINFSLRGLENIQAGHRLMPPRPPITLQMLTALRLTLKIGRSFDACIWAMALSAFWGMMRFGEVSVKSTNTFDGNLHLKRCDIYFDADLDGNPYARLDLPSAKTAKAGKRALRNLFQVVPAQANDPLFSWVDDKGNVHPMVKQTAIKFINGILTEWGWGTSSRHSFRIGGASYFLAQKVDPEIIHIASQWKSLAYETYIHAFKLSASRHMSNIAERAL